MNNLNSEHRFIPFETAGAIQQHGNESWQESSIKKALSESIIKSNHRQGSTATAIQEVIADLIRILEEQGSGNARKQLRLLGNYLRIDSHQSTQAKEFIKQLTWGIDAGALDNSCSGEKEATQAVMSFLEQRSQGRRLIAFDVGANSGDWTLQIANTTRSIDIHSFEPNKDLGKVLVHALQDYQGEGSEIKAFVNMFGIYSTTGKQVLYINGDSSEQATLSNDASRGCFENSIYSQEIKTLRGDEYCAAKGIGSIDYLKIDTEGTELEVLISFGKMIEDASIGFIQFEYGNASFYTGASMMRFFEVLGKNYFLARILPEGLQVAANYNSSLETFKWCNYLAVHASYKDFLDLQ